MKTALITGGSRGIGKDTAIELAKNGVNIAITYNNREDCAKDVVQTIIGIGSKAICIKMNQHNISDIDDAIIKTYNHYGTIDILINNAAIAQKKNFNSLTLGDWDNMLETNLRGPFLLCQKVILKMIKQNWGRIVNIASIGGQWGGVNQVHYAASKAALINLTMSLSKLYSKHGITVNAVSPGIVGTDIILNNLKIDINEITKDIPVGRLGLSNEIAKTVSFLCSNDASYITGQTININGGMYFG